MKWIGQNIYIDFASKDDSGEKYQSLDIISSFLASFIDHSMEYESTGPMTVVRMRYRAVVAVGTGDIV